MTAQPLSLRRSGADAGWDAVVVGARVAGASTALLLARAGLRVLVVDRARRGSDTLSTHALMRGGVLLLQRWGLLDGVVATGASPVRRVTFHYGPECLPVSLKPYAGVDALYAPRRTVLDALLVDAAERAGAQLRFGPSVVDLARDGTGQVVGVVLRDRSGAVSTEYARLVVGADGRDSLVAARVAAPITAAGAYRGAYAYGYWPTDSPDGYHWYYGGATARACLPGSSRRTTLWYACSSVPHRLCSPPRCATAARRRGCAAWQRGSTEGWPGSWRDRPSGRCGSSAGRQRFCVAHTGQAGRWPGTRAGGRTRCPLTASLTPSATPKRSPVPS